MGRCFRKQKVLYVNHFENEDDAKVADEYKDKTYPLVTSQ